MWCVQVVEALTRRFAKANRGEAENLDDHQLGQSFGSATAARPITAGAEAALALFLARVDRVNSDDYFLAKVTRVVLFGSYLRAVVSRLGDVDIAVGLRPKEADPGRLRELNDQRVAESEQNGDRFSRMLDRQVWWQMETFRFLKSRSRSISLVDYQMEKEFVDRVPHKVLFAAQEQQAKSAPPQPTQIRRARRPKDCPF